MTVVVLLSAYFRVMFMSCDSSLGTFCSPCDRLSFGLFSLILATSSSTSSRNVSRATEGRTGGTQSDLTWKG